MANASHLGEVTNLRLRFDRQEIRVACDSPKAARTLETALAEYLVDPEPGVEPDVAFLLNRPRALQRSHVLNDRSGFVLSTNKGIDTGLSALAGHLTAYLPPLPGCIRVRGRALIGEWGLAVCLPPLLAAPHVEEKDLMRAGIALMDRLALDIDVESGRLRQAPVPWPALAALSVGPGHVGPGGELAASRILAIVPPLSSMPTRADLVAALASNAIEGEPDQVLDACLALVESSMFRPLTSDATGSDVIEAVVGS